MKIAFTLGSEKISGGTYVIFEHAIRINRQDNFEVTIITEHVINKDLDLSWHPEARELNWGTYDLCNDEFDILIGTWWRTVYEMPRVRAKNYCYFVQSIESKFYSAPNDNIIRQLVDSTYKLGMPIITEATWIKDYLLDNYNINAYLVKNGIRKDVYTTTGEYIVPKLEKGKLRILVEGPLGVDFKNTEKSLELARKSNADEVWLMTSTPLKHHKLADRVFSQVPIFKTPEIYRSCDLVLKLSYVEGMFGPPLEMFHCGGTAVVYDVTGHDEYMVHKYNSYVVHRDNEQKVIDYLNYLKKHYKTLSELKSNASITASNWYGWDDAAECFKQSLFDIVEHGTINQVILKQNCAFFFNWYVIAENYRLANISKRATGRIKRTLKSLKVKFFV